VSLGCAPLYATHSVLGPHTPDYVTSSPHNPNTQTLTSTCPCLFKCCLFVLQVDLEPNGKVRVKVELNGSASEGNHFVQNTFSMYPIESFIMFMICLHMLQLYIFTYCHCFQGMCQLINVIRLISYII
jgi:hypothetical protein